MSTTKERPMLFSGPLVREIRAGRKTVTRRPVKPQPQFGLVEYRRGRWGQKPAPPEAEAARGTYIASRDNKRCPYGEPGDRLWVKETHLVRSAGECTVSGKRVVYRADHDDEQAAMLGGLHGGWRPSIFTKREYSRLLLEVTGVRVERLRSITCDEIRREGLSCPVHDRGVSFCHGSCTALHEHFYDGWDALYAHKPELHAERDPWLWVVDFRLLEDSTA